MTSRTSTPSARQTELLELAYEYALRNGLTDLSLRPLASAIGSSPRVLLFLFGSKDGLVRALLGRARVDEIALLGSVKSEGCDPTDLGAAALQVWAWLADEGHRSLLRLWVEAYARSLVDPDGAWSGFARATVEDWLAVLASVQDPEVRETPDGSAQRSLTLAVLRGALLDLLATGETDRVTAAVRSQLSAR